MKIYFPTDVCDWWFDITIHNGKCFVHFSRVLLVFFIALQWICVVTQGPFESIALLLTPHCLRADYASASRPGQTSSGQAESSTG
jgi:hypothetical protein